MRSVTGLLSVLQGAAVLTVCGCYSASPYTYGTYPGAYPGGYAVPPGGTYPPGGVISPGAPHLGAPTPVPDPLGAGPYGGGAPGGGWNDSHSAPGGDGVFDSYPDSHVPGGTPVPRYPEYPPSSANPSHGSARRPPRTDTAVDDFNQGSRFEQDPSGYEESQRPASRTPPGNPQSNFPMTNDRSFADPNKSTLGGPERPRLENVAPPPLDDGDLQPWGDDGAALDGPELIAPPQILQASATRELTATTARADSDAAAAQWPSPFGHEPRAYRWLRGLAEYDRQTGSWHIVYGGEADPTDEYGGRFRLVGDVSFETIQPGHVILVEGTVDPSAADGYGKPAYRVERLHGPLVPNE
ncbi:MAG: hypothetical protein ACREIV_03660 [Planctomycetaceae bacterium]